MDIWLPLLEKAYAKVMGSYYSISAGDPLHVLGMLTGAPVGKINDFSRGATLFRYLRSCL